MIRLTEKTHQELKDIIKPGDYVIDATAGNGHDAIFLAEQTGPNGHVYAFDIQKESIESSSQKIYAKEYHDRVSFFHSCHSKISENLPIELKGKIKAATFNLGYLPGGNKQLITTPKSTISAIEQTHDFLSSNGKITIITYRGHEGGKTEYQRVKNYIYEKKWAIELFKCDERSDSPILIIITKN